MKYIEANLDEYFVVNKAAFNYFAFLEFVELGINREMFRDERLKAIWCALGNCYQANLKPDPDQIAKDSEQPELVRQLFDFETTRNVVHHANEMLKRKNPKLTALVNNPPF